MPINIQYGPAGLVGALAVKAGEAAGQDRQHQYDMDSMRLSLAAQQQTNERVAGDKAFQLQSAMADRMIAASRMTPAADHVKEQADLRRADQDAKQKTYKTQLDTMLSSGDIDPAAYRRGLLAVATGNETLITDLLKPVKPTTEKPNISNTQEVQALRAPFAERRRLLAAQLAPITKGLADPIQTKAGADALRSQQGDIQAKINEEFQKEEEALQTFRQQGRGMYSPEAPAPKPGSTSLTFTPQMSESEQDILKWAKSMAGGAGAKVTGGGGSTTMTSQTRTPPAQYPDAVWNDEHGMWTVIRDGRLMGVK